MPSGSRSPSAASAGSHRTVTAPNSRNPTPSRNAHHEDDLPNSQWYVYEDRARGPQISPRRRTNSADRLKSRQHRTSSEPSGQPISSFAIPPPPPTAHELKHGPVSNDVPIDRSQCMLLVAVHFAQAVYHIPSSHGVLVRVRLGQYEGVTEVVNGNIKPSWEEAFELPMEGSDHLPLELDLIDATTKTIEGSAQLAFDYIDNTPQGAVEDIPLALPTSLRPAAGGRPPQGPSKRRGRGVDVDEDAVRPCTMRVSWRVTHAPGVEGGADVEESDAAASGPKVHPTPTWTEELASERLPFEMAFQMHLHNVSGLPDGVNPTWKLSTGGGGEAAMGPNVDNAWSAPLTVVTGSRFVLLSVHHQPDGAEEHDETEGKAAESDTFVAGTVIDVLELKEGEDPAVPLSTTPFNTKRFPTAADDGGSLPATGEKEPRSNSLGVKASISYATSIVQASKAKVLSVVVSHGYDLINAEGKAVRRPMVTVATSTLEATTKIAPTQRNATWEQEVRFLNFDAEDPSANNVDFIVLDAEGDATCSTASLAIKSDEGSAVVLLQCPVASTTRCLGELLISWTVQETMIGPSETEAEEEMEELTEPLDEGLEATPLATPASVEAEEQETAAVGEDDEGAMKASEEQGVAAPEQEAVNSVKLTEEGVSAEQGEEEAASEPPVYEETGTQTETAKTDEEECAATTVSTVEEESADAASKEKEEEEDQKQEEVAGEEKGGEKEAGNRAQDLIRQIREIKAKKDKERSASQQSDSQVSQAGADEHSGGEEEDEAQPEDPPIDESEPRTTHCASKQDDQETETITVAEEETAEQKDEVATHEESEEKNDGSEAIGLGTLLTQFRRASGRSDASAGDLSRTQGPGEDNSSSETQEGRDGEDEPRDGASSADGSRNDKEADDPSMDYRPASHTASHATSQRSSISSPHYSRSSSKSTIARQPGFVLRFVGTAEEAAAKQRAAEGNSPVQGEGKESSQDQAGDRPMTNIPEEVLYGGKVSKWAEALGHPMTTQSQIYLLDEAEEEERKAKALLAEELNVVIAADGRGQGQLAHPLPGGEVWYPSGPLEDHIPRRLRQPIADRSPAAPRRSMSSGGDRGTSRQPLYSRSNSRGVDSSSFLMPNFSPSTVRGGRPTSSAAAGNKATPYRPPWYGSKGQQTPYLTTLFRHQN